MDDPLDRLKEMDGYNSQRAKVKNGSWAIQRLFKNLASSGVGVEVDKYSQQDQIFLDDLILHLGKCS